MTFRISGCIYGKDKISVSCLTFSRSKISKKTKPITFTLTVDLERQGQTHFYMTFLIFGCIYDTDLILVSILAISRSTSVISSYFLGGFYPQNPKPPRKTPKTRKKLKMHKIHSPPDMCFPSEPGV